MTDTQTPEKLTVREYVLDTADLVSQVAKQKRIPLGTAFQIVAFALSRLDRPQIPALETAPAPAAEPFTDDEIAQVVADATEEASA